MDVTAAIMQSQSWMVSALLAPNIQAAIVDCCFDAPSACVHAGQCNPYCPNLLECAKGIQLSPQMRSAIDQLADLRAGRIVCARDAASDL